MSEIDFDKLSKKEQDVLGNIAINLDGGHNSKTIKALLKKGLIIETEEHQGALTIKHYAVPLPIHMQWCYWCSHQVETGKIKV
jgi:hypothetical protein